MTNQRNRGRCIVHRKPGEAVEIAGARITVYVPRFGRAVLVIEPPAGTPVYRVDGAELTEVVQGEGRYLPPAK